MAWARGHKNDGDFFAAEARDAAWSCESVLSIYRHIEDWRHVPQRGRRIAEELDCQKVEVVSL
jgi:choline dehydrogenase